MARTKASVGAKVAAGKSNKARCSVAPAATSSSNSGTSKSSKKYSGGNPVCPRETPKWQKPITNFYVSTPNSEPKATIEEDLDAGPSKSKPKRNIILSDDEEETEVPKNRELEESFILEPLDGESSHKIDEYFTPKSNADQSNKENIDQNSYRKSGKRDLEDDDIGQSGKRMKIS